MSDSCPVCKDADVEDIRHVAVECFYAVNEVAPDAQKLPFFREVPEEGGYWGITRRYPAGTRDDHTTEQTGESSFAIKTKQVPIDPIRLIEMTMFNVPCCKNCRADFLTMFGRWASGGLVTRSEPDEVNNVAIRENGRIVYISEAEFYRRQDERNRVD